jgi:hypothetical protein
MAIQGERKVKLSIESILSKISEYDIFRFYMTNRKWKLNVATHSPFRKDDNPSFIIGTKHGNVSFIDFADTSKRGNCFNFVQMLYNISNFPDVLKMIDRDFGLGISTGIVGDYKVITSSYTQPLEIGKTYSLIQVITRKFTHEELVYWNQYYQDIDDLKANNVYSIKKLYLNKQEFSLKDSDLRFGYLYDGHWKIYVPYTTNKRGKWLSNVPLATAKGLENLKPDKNTLICKSLKDYMVCRKVYPYVCHIQNESTAALSEEVVEFIKNNSKEVFYGGDSDVPGKKASFAITESFGFRHINPPDDLLPEVKDFADWAKLEGLEIVRLHFRKKGLF